MVEIVEVKTKKQIKDFINFPLKLYKGNEYYVPNLYIDEKNIFSKNFTYADACECVHFLAYKDGVLVGRIEGINQRSYNDAHQTKIIRFGRFDAVNDQEVANALFDSVIAWGKQNGMKQIVGPLGFSDFEREGLLIEGFDQPQTFEEQYNYDYYQNLIENYGFVKDVDWVEFQIRKNPNIDKRILAIGDRVLKMNNLKLVPVNNISKLKYIKKYKEHFFRMVDECYKDLYGVCPFTEKSKKALVAEITFVLDKKYLRIIADKDDNVVSFSLLIPSIAEAVKKSNGHITPRFIFNMIKCLKKPKVIDFLLVGVDPKYRSLGLPSVYLKLIHEGFDSGIDHYETNLNLEDNTDIIGCWRYFDSKENKKRRCYKLEINNK